MDRFQRKHHDPHAHVIHAPHKPGLGYEIDRDAVENLTVARF